MRADKLLRRNPGRRGVVLASKAVCSVLAGVGCMCLEGRRRDGNGAPWVEPSILRLSGMCSV